ncbi:MAG: glycosyltransferase family 2 protein [Bacteroidota bacterium]
MHSTAPEISREEKPSQPVSLSVVMPAYNEEAMIENVVREHLALLSELSGELQDWEILCLDDGSTDSTGNILESMAAADNRVRVLRHPQNKGIDESLADLYRAARGTHIYVTASDGQWPAGNLAVLQRTLFESQADLVVGVRRNRRQVYGISRLVVSYLFNLLPRILFGVKTADAGSNKLGRKEIFCAPIISRSPFAEAERIVKAQLDGFRVAYVSIDFFARTSGTTTGASRSNILASARDLLRCVKVYGFRPGS